MNQTINVVTNKTEPNSPAAKKEKAIGAISQVVGSVAVAVESVFEARKSAKAVREAKTIKDQLRKGKEPKSFEQAIKEL